MKSFLPLGILIFLFSQCASIYHPIDPPKVAYSFEQENNEDLSFSYKYDVLAQSGNRKYSRKEKHHGFSVVSVRLRNNTNRTLSFARDIDLFILFKEDKYTLLRMSTPLISFVRR